MAELIYQGESIA